MVFVKVRETYDLHTIKDRMTVIGIHTPKPEIIKRNYPGLLMQCKAYRPYSCDVRIACASVLPLDPKGVGLTENDVAPEDVFNPILYKAISNKGMSQLEARINALMGESTYLDVDGQTAGVDADTLTTLNDEFGVYYGLLSDTNGWRHASPQQGLSMSGLKPLVYEMVYNVGDSYSLTYPNQYAAPLRDGSTQHPSLKAIVGKAKEMPFINCTAYDMGEPNTGTLPGFTNVATNGERTVPYIPVVVGAVIIPPSRLHELYYRMVVEWTLEFSSIRSMVEIADYPNGIQWLGNHSHYQNYSYSATKEALTGTDESILDSDTCMVSANVDVNKVM